MGGFMKLSARTRYNNNNRTVSSSPPLEFKRITTTASTDDSSTVSYDAVAKITSNPNPSGSPGRKKCPHKHDRSCPQEGAAAAAGGQQQQDHRSHTRQRGWEQHQDQQHRGIISHPFASTKRSSSVSVSFGDITVREYCRSIGDWWDVPNGLGLGWEYYELPSVPIPNVDQEETRRYIAKLTRNKVKKFKAKVKVMLLVNRNKLQSNGVIRAESITGLDTSANDLEKMARRKSKKKMGLQFDERPSTCTIRKQILIDFGYDSTELTECETERQQLRFEYHTWSTRTKKKSGSTSTISSSLSSSDECGGPGDGRGSSSDGRPSQLLIDRVLADVRHALPSTTTNTITTDAAATSASNVTTNITASSGDTTADNYCYCI
ncbi:hypothetical protein FRACYDRAFT_254489 [Fragilariopsis cylindrus CCMP1102]|uniref:Uncharacterized protein n=1 Tax=Fragilariopsis cylindrus CCMP1102 TaxID=635003 RepID=A0A1E7EKN9_9STRA|nr:hypothetical protein FRACYDRAFT_254489 [Fragilariopsis cylindrus CCMP1102]|eukprot:OEU06472.1 hypothetical protein FRACYDRAFT_254489 [Fragilariopsis cylindrus CCMP1102]